jgi:hypothetical protein
MVANAVKLDAAPFSVADSLDESKFPMLGF